MAYSSGFNPHPRISYAGAAPTGAASEAEYLEIGLARTVRPGQVQADLAAALPDGLDVLAVVESPGGALADRLQASHWQLDLAQPLAECREAAARFLATDSVTVSRMTKKGLREFDCRAAVQSLEVTSAGAGVPPRPGASAHRADGPSRRRADRAGAGGRPPRRATAHCSPGSPRARGTRPPARSATR